MKLLLESIRIFIALTVLTGIAYVLAIAVIARLFFPYQAHGSLITADGKIIGSELIGQRFSILRYFQSRPSAIAYNPLPSGASNLSVTGLQLKDSVESRRRAFRISNGLADTAAVPPDMLCASASGLDPHISPDAARLQIERISRQRGFTAREKAALVSLVEHSIDKRQWGFLGEPRVNVLRINLALDSLGRQSWE
jgi:potassium-transporting ATPase KdpC subunit